MLIFYFIFLIQYFYFKKYSNLKKVFLCLNDIANHPNLFIKFTLDNSTSIKLLHDLGIINPGYQKPEFRMITTLFKDPLELV